MGRLVVIILQDILHRSYPWDWRTMYVLIAIFVHWLSLLLSILFFPNIQVQSKLLFGMLHEALLIYYT